MLSYIVACFAGPHHALPAPGIRLVLEASRGGDAHGLLQAKEARDYPDCLQCWDDPDTQVAKIM